MSLQPSTTPHSTRGCSWRPVTGLAKPASAGRRLASRVTFPFRVSSVIIPFEETRHVSVISCGRGAPQGCKESQVRSVAQKMSCMASVPGPPRSGPQPTSAAAPGGRSFQPGYQVRGGDHLRLKCCCIISATRT